MKKNTKPKISNTTTDIDAPSKNDRWDEYLNTITLQMTPAKGEHKLRAFQGFAIWAKENEEAFHIHEYWDMKGIEPMTVSRWLKERKIYEQLYNQAKREIGRRRDKIVIKERLSSNTGIAFTLPQYLPDWRDERDERAALKVVATADSAEPTKLKIEVTTIPTTAEVDEQLKKRENERRDNDKA